MTRVRALGIWSILATGLLGVAIVTRSAGIERLRGESPRSEDTPVTARFAGHGRWRGRSPGDATRSWHVHAVKREDGSLRAKLSVPEAAELQDVTVEGHVDGRDLFGVLLNANGETITSFEATLDERGRGGKFVIGNGASGTWDYDAATGRELRRMMGVPEVEVAETGGLR